MYWFPAYTVCSVSLAQSQLSLVNGSANFLRKPQNLLNPLQLPVLSRGVPGLPAQLGAHSLHWCFPYRE